MADVNSTRQYLCCTGAGNVSDTVQVQGYSNFQNIRIQIQLYIIIFLFKNKIYNRHAIGIFDS
jgi:hypothetical protein